MQCFRGSGLIHKTNLITSTKIYQIMVSHSTTHGFMDQLRHPSHNGGSWETKQSANSQTVKSPTRNYEYCKCLSQYRRMPCTMRLMGTVHMITQYYTTSTHPLHAIAQLIGVKVQSFMTCVSCQLKETHTRIHNAAKHNCCPWQPQ